MSDQNILLVEDEISIARFLELELQHEGYSLTVRHDGRQGLETALKGEFALIILDVMLPSLNGMEVLRRLRQSQQTPVIILTAKDDTTDKVMGLDIGADDYMTKPFAIEELLARIRKALKRQQAASSGKKIVLGCVEINVDKHSVQVNGEEVRLTKKEYDLLSYLAENSNIVLSREKILGAVWGYDYLGDTNIVDVYIRYLRSKLDEEYGLHLIQTVRGVGYVIKYEHT